MLSRGLHRLEGSVRVELRGGGAERFFTRCAQTGVCFREVERAEIDRVSFTVGLPDFFRLRQQARRCGVTLRVTEKRGLPFAAGRMLRHRVLAVGLILSAAAMLWLSGRVWTIRVEGCVETTPGEILSLLSQAGLRTGARRQDLPLKTIKSDVMAGTDKLSRLTINFRGIHALVQVWERSEGPGQIDESVPCDVISPVTGIILRLRVRQGTARVKVGDTVQAGDVLVSGVIPGAEGSPDRTVHALAEADIRTWHTGMALIPGELRAALPGELGKKQRFFRVGERIFPLGFVEKPAFLWYDTQIGTKALRLHPDQVFPLEWGWTAQRELRAGDAPTAEELSARAEARMTERLLASHPGAELAGSRFSLEVTESGAFLATLRAELVEICGTEVPLAHNNTE